MIKIKQQHDVCLLRGQIAGLYHIFQQDGNQQLQDRAKDLAIKLNKKEFLIAFCGHFSAGKSSMINQLMGENILPSSPIPTSANLVKIKSGDDYAKVFIKGERPLLYPAPYDYEKVKSYCKDGQQIQSIEISYSKTSIPKETIIMDTPGIDSTDDAHRIATESALHLADLIFYVMDYNHVQSELNFLFTKELTDAGKEVYLVINQIDKHREEELRFLDFQESVYNSFASWGVKPAKIFYTSLKEPNHPYNQFADLREFIDEKINNRLELLPNSIYQSLKKLGEQHHQFLIERDKEEINRLEMQLKNITEDERKSLSENVQKLAEQYNQLEELLKQNEQVFYAEINNVLDNAYLMPFQTRELAEHYLASRQPDFKIGLLFSKQKTESERKQRLENFYTDFSEKVTSQIDWHMKDLMQKLVRENEIKDNQLLKYIQNFNVKFNQELLASTVKSGAMLTGNYVLNYTNDLSEAIKKLAKEQIFIFKTNYLELLKEKNGVKQQRLEKELSKLKHYLAIQNNITVYQEQIMVTKRKIEEIISSTQTLDEFIEIAEQLKVEDNLEPEVIYSQKFDGGEIEAINQIGKKQHLIQVTSDKHIYQPKRDIELLNAILRTTAEQVKSVPGFKKLSKQLIAKADRMENQSFTIALFGAFSAGKSSFANALLGEKILPVSPNPTTAAINKIMPITDKYKHGTVLVKLKSAVTLLEDINRSLSVFEKNARTIEEAIVFSKQVVENIREIDPFEKLHFSFLNAFTRGIINYKNQLGDTIQADLQTFAGFVADEKQSCLVEWIEVYYDCELTQKGITLVDTPGADSINARHTGVAFEYIKNSDAILFVTYYNHAFSKADREFLIQLGRVKETFALDKMFFIVNAIDLAQDDEEITAVLDYVREQLTVYGIRNPHLYPVSSLQALEAKLQGNQIIDSGFRKFENHFETFIEQDLKEIAINTAQSELERLQAQLQSYIRTSEEDKETKALKRKELEKEQNDLLEWISKQTSDILMERMLQESNELVFYIKQRVFLRFNDFVKESFNPAVLKADGRNLKKALLSALNNFLEDIGYDFAQEMRATTLRIEAFIRDLMAQTEKAIVSYLHEKNMEISFSPYEVNKFISIDFEKAFVSLDEQYFKKALAYFKNPKSFFENNDRKLLCDELEINLQEPADNYLAKEKENVNHHYSDQLNTEFNRLIFYLSEQVEEYYQGIFASISNEVPIEELKTIEASINKRMYEFHI